MKKADRTKKGMIFNIQKFSVNDGPGIRTVVFFKGCPLHCAWCANPESQYSEMQVLWNMEKCVRCHHCMEICPKKAITFFSNEIKINPYICNGLKNVLQERCRQKERRRPYREYWTLFFRIKFFMKKAVVGLLCLVAKYYISQTLHYSFF